MKFILSGEGATDIGTGARPGPMAMIVDKIAMNVCRYSLHESIAFNYVAETELNARAKGLRASNGRKTLVQPGAKRGIATGEFFKNAKALAIMAHELQTVEGPDCPVGAVLFRDCDGTNTSERCRFDRKWESMQAGFASEEFPHGVPMIPKPKSEAWILCALKKFHYMACEKLEELPGNDASPKSAKSMLDHHLASIKATLNDLPDMIRNPDGGIDPARINMPSFDLFRDRLSEVVRTMLGLPA